MFDRLRKKLANSVATRIYDIIDDSIAQRDFVAALEYTEGVLENHPKNGTAILYKGYCLNHLERFSESADFVLARLVEEQGYEEVYRVCCVALQRCDRIETLDTVAKTALRLWPDDFDFLVYRVHSLTRLTDIEAVRPLAEIARSRLPEATEPWHFIVIASASELNSELGLAQGIVAQGIEKLGEQPELTHMASYLDQKLNHGEK